MQLHYKKWEGNKGPLIILHGLFGSHRNWIAVASELNKHGYTIYALDLRNHGYSPHTETHSVKQMASDVTDWMRGNKIARAGIIGHSMGGLVATEVSIENPEMITSLIMIDIAPRSYPPSHENEFKALEIDVSHMRTRKEVDNAMSEVLESVDVRQFLQTNLERNANGFRWRLNVAVLKKSAYLSNYKPGGSYNGPVLVISGIQSPYVKIEDEKHIQERFPSSRIIKIQDAGHWLHHTHRKIFLDTVLEFLNENL